jgi:hypothetical protein
MQPTGRHVRPDLLLPEEMEYRRQDGDRIAYLCRQVTDR